MRSSVLAKVNVGFARWPPDEFQYTKQLTSELLRAFGSGGQRAKFLLGEFSPRPQAPNAIDLRASLKIHE